MRSKIFWWTCIVIWCGLIFHLSNKSAPESSSQSLIVAELLNRLIKGLLGPHAFVVSETVVRKTAHFIEYLVLGCLLFMGFLDRTKQRRVIFLVFVSGLAFAISDETHQLFVPGRTARPFDVLIDMAGITVAVGIMWQTVIAKVKRPVL